MNSNAYIFNEPKQIITCVPERCQPYPLVELKHLSNEVISAITSIQQILSLDSLYRIRYLNLLKYFFVLEEEEDSQTHTY